MGGRGGLDIVRSVSVTCIVRGVFLKQGWLHWEVMMMSVAYREEALALDLTVSSAPPGLK